MQVWSSILLCMFSLMGKITLSMFSSVAQFYQEVRRIDSWKRFLLGFLFIILIPICLAIYIGLWLAQIAIAAVIGTFLGPIGYLQNRAQKINSVQECLLCPFSIPYGAIQAICDIIGIGPVLLRSIFIMIKSIPKSLFCNQTTEEEGLF